MTVELFMVSLVVPDMDDAIAHFTGDWGFALVNDNRHVSGHRWVEIAPSGGARLRLVEACNASEEAVIGRQAGGRVAFFVSSRDFDTDLNRLTKGGVQIAEAERHESYGRIVVLADKYGNCWDFIEAQMEGPR